MNFLFQELAQGEAGCFGGAWTWGHVSNETGTTVDSITIVHPILTASLRRVEPGSCCKNGGRYKPGVKIDDTIMTDGYPIGTPPFKEAVAVDETLLCGALVIFPVVAKEHCLDSIFTQPHVLTPLIVRGSKTGPKTTNPPHSYWGVL